MRRRRGGGEAPAEACGVWLDTAELKRGPARPLSAKLKAPTRIPQRKLPQPGTKQSTIPTFFSPHTDDKENSRPSPCTPNKDCEASGAPLAAGPVKILALPQLEGALEEAPGAQQGSWKTPQDALQLQGESQSQSKSSCGAGGDSCCCSFCHGSEHRGIISPRNKSQLFPGGTALGSRKAQPWSTGSSGLALAGTENTNPAAARAVCCSAQSPVRAQPLREQGQLLGESCRQLWCQDSQGNRVIAHRARASQQEPGSEPLFTQDSEGNRVIKH